MDNLTVILEKSVMAMHIPIVILLAVLSWQVFKSFGTKAFKYICYGWAFQLFHVLSSFIKVCNFDIEFLNTSYYYTLIEFVDIFGSFLFLFAVWVANKKFEDFQTFVKKKAPQIFIGLILIIVSVYLIYENKVGIGDNDTKPFISWHYIPITFFGFYCLKALASYFSLQFKDNANVNLLYYGTLSYGILQFLAIFSFDWSMEIGYTLSLGFKSLILFGLQGVLIFYAKKRVEAKVKQEELLKLQKETEAVNFELNRILGRTFHEISAPLRTVENRLDLLISDKLRKYKISKHTKLEHEIIASNVNRLIAVMGASIKMYEEGIGKEKFDEGVFDRLREDQELGPNNVNTLIEIAIITLKEIINDEESISFTKSYGGGCNIICYPIEITQSIYNILKNSYDSFKNGIGKIFIKTKVYKSLTDKNEIIKVLKVEIADNGPGIPENIIDNIFIEGFTTKGGGGRGFGLKIVEELVTKNQGHLNIESPYDFSRFNSNLKSGTLVTLTFPIIT